MKDQLIIDEQFSGAPGTGNGGYACGLIANYMEGAAEITLRRPPPVNKLLDIEKTQDNKVLLYDENGTIAEGNSIELDIDVPSPPSFEEAKQSTLIPRDITEHIYPILASPMYNNCFVCGTQRREGDGLRLWPGPVQGKSYVATTWIPDVCFVDETGKIRNEIVWAALDCPSGWGGLHEARIQKKSEYGLLGRLAAQIDERPRPGKRYVICGWYIEQEGRKSFCGSALFSDDGALFAKAKSTWIELTPDQLRQLGYDRV